MVAEDNEIPKTNHFFDQDPQLEEQLVDQLGLSLHLQIFMEDPYNQEMMERFFKSILMGL